MRYQPKRASKRWLEGAPRTVLACYDSGAKTIDRYTVLYGAPFWNEEVYGRDIPYIAMSADPFGPLGFGQHGVMQSIHRDRCGHKIKWSDLPPDCRRAVELDCAEDSDISK